MLRITMFVVEFAVWVFSLFAIVPWILCIDIYIARKRTCSFKALHQRSAFFFRSLVIFSI